MDGVRNQVTQTIVDQAMAGDRREALKLRTGNDNAKVVGAVGGTCVSDMLVGLVDDLKMGGLQGFQAAGDELTPLL